MAKKKSHMDLASMSFSQLEQKLEEYETELIEHRQDEDRDEDRCEWLLDRISQIKKELLRRRSSNEQGIQSESEVQESQEILGHQKEEGTEGQREEQTEEGQKRLFGVRTAVQVGIVVGTVVLAAIRYQVVQDILIGIFVVLLASVVLSLVIGKIITLFSKVSLKKAVFGTFCAMLVSWVLGNILNIPNAIAGKMYWDNRCLCFTETEEVRKEREAAEERQARWGCRDVLQSPWDGRVPNVDYWLKENLLDPDSLRYIEWGKLTHMDGGCFVWVKFRAKNSFGGYVIKNQVFYMDQRGEVIGVSGR